MSTLWSPATSVATSWTPDTKVATGYQGRMIANLGAIADDTLYLADDTVLTADDSKLQSFVAPAISWT